MGCTELLAVGAPPASPGVTDFEGEATESLCPAPTTASPQPNPPGFPAGWGHTHPPDKTPPSRGRGLRGTGSRPGGHPLSYLSRAAP